MRQDKRYFGTDGIRGRFGVAPITPEFAYKLGKVIGELLREEADNPTVIVAKDTRFSSDILEANIVAGLSASYVSPKCANTLPTPALAYLIQHHAAQAGIMITASHNTYADNGFKCFSNKSIKFTSETQYRIEKKLSQEKSAKNIQKISPAPTITTAQQDYMIYCQKTVPNNFSLIREKIVLDCAEGATFEIAPQLFQSFGAHVICLGHDPNGYNINKSGAVHPHIVKQRVLSEEATLGIAFDGDGDRLVMVDHTGFICDGDDLLFILAKADKQVKHSHYPQVVGTYMSNEGLVSALHQIGIRLIRTPVGDHHVYNTLEQINGRFGSEPSGHIICRHLSTTSDALVAALQVLVALNGRSLYEARQGLHKLPQYQSTIPMANIKCALESATIDQIIKNAQKACETLKGRLVVRASGTEPLIRIMAEGVSPTIPCIVNQLVQSISAVKNKR
jgi:phosphoglucosamine mutase